MIIISIDVTKLDKARFKEVTRKNGQKAVFCDLVLFDTNSEYGDYLVKQGVSKQERERRVEMPILGNGKNVGGNRGGSRRSETEEPQRPAAQPSGVDDIPF